MAQAVLDERHVSIRYHGWQGVRDRRIAPLGLVLKAGHWYCVAAISGDRRIYGVGAIEALATEATTFERPAGFDLAAHWRSSLARFEAELRPEITRLRASPEGLRRLVEMGDHAERAVLSASPPDTDGWSTLDLPLEAGERGA